MHTVLNAAAVATLRAGVLGELLCRAPYEAPQRLVCAARIPALAQERRVRSGAYQGVGVLFRLIQQGSLNTLRQTNNFFIPKKAICMPA